MICRYSKAFLAGTSSNLREVVEIDEFAVFPLAFYISSYVSGITSALIAHYDNTPFCIPAGTNKDNLE